MGWGMHSAMWGETVNNLAEFCRVTTVDLPGHGMSPPMEPAQAYSLPVLADAVAEVTPANAVWLGWSLGGLVAMQAALDFPVRVTRLILVATSACFVQRADWHCALSASVLDDFAAGLQQDYRGVLRRFLALQARGCGAARQQTRALRELLFTCNEPKPAALVAGLALLKESDLRSVLPEVLQSTLLISGQNDSLVPPDAVKNMVQLLPDARLEIVSGAGHAPFLSHVTHFQGMIGDFINE